jgi:hypothetical protein
MMLNNKLVHFNKIFAFANMPKFNVDYRWEEFMGLSDARKRFIKNPSEQS